MFDIPRIKFFSQRRGWAKKQFFKVAEILPSRGVFSKRAPRHRARRTAETASSIRFAYPHSLSNQAIILISFPPLTLV